MGWSLTRSLSSLLHPGSLSMKAEIPISTVSPVSLVRAPRNSAISSFLVVYRISDFLRS